MIVVWWKFRPVSSPLMTIIWDIIQFNIPRSRLFLIPWDTIQGRHHQEYIIYDNWMSLKVTTLQASPKEASNMAYPEYSLPLDYFTSHVILSKNNISMSTLFTPIQHTESIKIKPPPIDYFPASGILSNQESNETCNSNPSLRFFLPHWVSMHIKISILDFISYHVI